jgi:hypothetical protein
LAAVAPPHRKFAGKLIFFQFPSYPVKIRPRP